MKTSVLISSFAALCLMITFAESPARHSADKKNANQVGQTVFVPVNQVFSESDNKMLLNLNNVIVEKSPVLTSEDFSYLKFRVADYMETDASAQSDPELPSAIAETDCSYLQFNLINNTEVTSFEDIELPVNDLDYLRFDVNNYLEPNSVSFENMDLPTDNFSYLKFDVNDYANKAEISSLDDIELPANNLEHLRFDVDNYLETNSDSFETIDLPSDNFSYLKFDATDYSDNSVVGSFEDIDLPLDDFEYLRFGVDNYMDLKTNSFETMELPADNFSYLKFDVYKYAEGNDIEAEAIGELPAAETQPYCSL